jgi:hypothetical protein
MDRQRHDLMGAVVRKRFVGFGWFMGKVTGWSQERGMYMCVPAANPTRSDALAAHAPRTRTRAARVRARAGNVRARSRAPARPWRAANSQPLGPSGRAPPLCGGRASRVLA